MSEPTAPTAHLCAAWCECHDNAGARDAWCVTAPRRVEPIARDSAAIAVTVGRYAERDLAGHWTENPSLVELSVGPAEAADLRPHEARQLARLLLAAADIADGTAVTW